MVPLRKKQNILKFVVKQSIMAFVHGCGQRGFIVERKVYVQEPIQVPVHPLWVGQHIPVVHVREPVFEPTFSNHFGGPRTDPFTGRRQSETTQTQSQGPYCSHCGVNRGSDQGPYCSKCGKANGSGSRRKTAAELNAEMGLYDAGYRNGAGAVARIHYPRHF